MVDEKQDVTVDSTSHEQSWSQVRETVRMLFLAVAQIEVAVGDSDDSVNRLTDAFTTMMSYEQQIAQAAQALDDAGDEKSVYDGPVTFDSLPDVFHPLVRVFLYAVDISGFE